MDKVIFKCKVLFILQFAYSNCYHYSVSKNVREEKTQDGEKDNYYQII